MKTKKDAQHEALCEIKQAVEEINGDSGIKVLPLYKDIVFAACPTCRTMNRKYPRREERRCCKAFGL